MQRFCDIVFCLAALLLLLPLLIPVVFVLRFTGEGEIFYLQERIGYQGKTFKLIKFATMLKNSPNMGTGTITVSNDPRVLPFGRLLRKTKINELPQLLNILAGDMSIIGPRPQTARCFNAFPAKSQNRIITIRPGLSGLGSIVFRDEEKFMELSAEPERLYDEIIMPYKGKLEEWYVENKSVIVYFQCIILTIMVIIKPASNSLWKSFKNLPSPPTELEKHLNYDL